jgi:hypothetical protein
MGQGHPHWTPVHQELDIHGIGVSRGNGHDQSLVNAMHAFLRPAVDGVEVLVHGNRKLYQDQAHGSQSETSCDCSFKLGFRQLTMAELS